MPVTVTTPEPGIACVILSNPERRNALDLGMFEDLAGLWPRMAADPGLRAVVLRGEGDAAFCAGADLSEHLDRRADIDDLIDAALLKTRFFPKPLIAAISGPCVAGGLELALAADIRVADPAARLGFPEVRWGILPSGGGTMKLTREIGHTAAMRLLLSGRLISGHEAARIGLVSELAEPGAVFSAAAAMARELAANSSIAMLGVKAAAHLAETESFARRETEERRILRLVRASGHPEVGKAAFLGGRKPDFPPAIEQDAALRSLVPGRGERCD